MTFEAGAYNEQEKKKKKLDEKKEKEQQKKILEQEKTKEYVKTEIEVDEGLHQLKVLVDQGVITQETAKKIAETDHIDEEVVREIFEKIDEIDDLKDVDTYLPSEMRITKDEYRKALTDDIFRVQMIIKINAALAIIANHVVPDSTSGINLFSGMLTLLDKNLIKLQENTIDVKDNLDEIHEKKFPKEKKSLWDIIKEFLSELLK